ncbi:MAG: hypothetical protein HY619_04980 [Thaumarchaeota archaeon]|nr:hypothetical protein [Nitrososphaerota archaeon]
MSRGSNFRQLAPDKILAQVPPEKGFHFHTDVEAYTGRYASSLEEFSKMLEQVDLKSIEFHLRRKDFENWVRYLGDQAIPLQLAKVRKKNLSSDKLRSEVLSIIRRRIDKLRGLQ